MSVKPSPKEFLNNIVNEMIDVLMALLRSQKLAYYKNENLRGYTYQLLLDILRNLIFIQKEIANISDEEAKELIREIGFVATDLKRIFGNLTIVIEDYLK